MAQALALVTATYESKDTQLRVKGRLLQICNQAIGQGSLLEENTYKFLSGMYESKILINRVLGLIITLDGFDLNQTYDDSQVSNFVDNRWQQAFNIAI